MADFSHCLTLLHRGRASTSPAPTASSSERKVVVQSSNEYDTMMRLPTISRTPGMTTEVTEQTGMKMWRTIWTTLLSTKTKTWMARVLWMKLRGSRNVGNDGGWSSGAGARAGTCWQSYDPSSIVSTSRSPTPYPNTPISAVSTSPPHPTHPNTHHTHLPPDVIRRKPCQAACLIGKPHAVLNLSSARDSDEIAPCCPFLH